MRPKIVILTLVVALGLVGIIFVLKGMLGGRAGADGQTPTPEASGESPPVAANVQVNPNSSNLAAFPEQSRAAKVQNELDQINELQAEGADSPTIIPVLLAKVTHPEAEVRKAALEALVQLDDTNAVPGLEQAMAQIQDPREKVAMMDAIEFLKLPGVTPEVPPAMDITANKPASNPAKAIRPKPVTNPKQPGARNRSRRVVPPAAPVAPPQ